MPQNHQNSTVSKDQIKKYVYSRTQKHPIKITRILICETNEVYNLGFSDGPELILKISPSRGLSDFKQEVWAIKQVMGRGVPIQKILSLDFLTVGSNTRPFFLLEKIKGEPLLFGNIDFYSMAEGKRKGLVETAGKILSNIHSVETKGYGRLIGPTKGQCQNSKRFFYSLVNNQFLSLRERRAVNKIAQNVVGRYLVKKPCLNHGDFSLKHIIVNGESLSGIIDWGLVRSDIPVLDFAEWDFWNSEEIPIEWLKSGYKNKDVFDADFEILLHFLKIVTATEVINSYQEVGRPEMVAKARRRLNRDMAFFNN